MKKLRIVSNNPTYAYKGKMFEKADKLGNPIDHQIGDDNLAQTLLDIQNSPFREVDDDGETIPNESDLAKEEKVTTNAASRTVLSDSAKRHLAAQAEKGDITLEDIEGKEPEGPPSEADTAVVDEAPAPAPAKPASSRGRTKATKKAAASRVTIEKSPPKDDSTDGAVEAG